MGDTLRKRGKIFLEINTSPSGKLSESEFILWTTHKREDYDISHRGEIVTSRISLPERKRLIALALAVHKRNAKRERRRMEGIFNITDEEYIRKATRGRAEDAKRRKARASGKGEKD